ncbi:hypothetical protein COV06_02555 [Candidatus Uhrbacteria bacterium CG10_big_fil_rev_8_21_14_0_10_50_16]|uniref:Uncharacterized protein n=1 Tax=Candidatus Uhrbacteria bacterium CG10_big_fil_rev_8_21_14_0_10_50_16 TaxID=1975039 RepID=A0A2H0RLV6_9BACT|nr:MAG: hypothetical protein COV06_02555 [Candidatus Uhrbacteria bacterium CG10_big_fil_rev_8_21_14_0_10_50_16]
MEQDVSTESKNGHRQKHAKGDFLITVHERNGLVLQLRAEGRNRINDPDHEHKEQNILKHTHLQ